MYVANRVAEVKNILAQHSIQVKYVSTKDNPADYLSRGCSSKQLKSNNWLHGPSWLLTCEFPEQTNLEVVSEGVKTTSFLHESPIVYDSSEEVVLEGVKTTSFLHESPIVESTALSPSHDDSNASADANGGMFLPDASAPRTSGSSQVSSPAIGIHDGCMVSASPTVVPESLTPPPVDTQTRESVEGDAVDAPTIARPQRRAARQQRALLGRLIEDDLL